MAAMVEEPKTPPPAWLVSFGDMMTLILTFFILLVSLSTQRDFGLMAAGLGSFVSALRSHGLPGILSDSERREVFEHFRRRFNLPPEADPARREAHLHASELELLRAVAADALAPHDELFQPQVATFGADSATLTAASRDYLDRLAETLRPLAGQVLLLEGHALDAGPRFADDDRWLAFERARAVREHLVARHGFDPRRVQARAWIVEEGGASSGTSAVDARLVTPARRGKD